MFTEMIRKKIILNNPLHKDFIKPQIGRNLINKRLRGYKLLENYAHIIFR